MISKRLESDPISPPYGRSPPCPRGHAPPAPPRSSRSRLGAQALPTATVMSQPTARVLAVAVGPRQRTAQGGDMGRTASGIPPKEGTIGGIWGQSRHHHLCHDQRRLGKRPGREADGPERKALSMTQGVGGAAAHPRSRRAARSCRRGEHGRRGVGLVADDRESRSKGWSGPAALRSRDTIGRSQAGCGRRHHTVRVPIAPDLDRTSQPTGQSDQEKAAATIR